MNTSSTTSHPVMDWESKNLPETWRKFRRHAELMFSGPLAKTPNPQKASYLLIWIGEKGRDICDSWKLSSAQEHDLDYLFTSFEKHIEPKKNDLITRFSFHNRNQLQEECLEDYFAHLQRQARECNFGDFTDTMVRDRFVFGISSSEIREKLLMEGNALNKDSAIDIARTIQAAKQGVEKLKIAETTVEETKEIDAMYKQNKSNQNQIPSQNPPAFQKRSCPNCGSSHAGRFSCPAKGKQCLKCLKYNHFAQVCRSSMRRGNVHEIEDEIVDQIQIGAVQNNKKKRRSRHQEEAYANINLNGNNVRMKLDTGASANVLPKDTYDKLPHKDRPKLQKVKNVRLTSYTGQSLKMRGQIQLCCKYKDREVNHTFYVVETSAPPIASLELCLDLQLIQLIYAIEKPNNKSTDKEMPSSNKNETKSKFMTKESVLHDYKDIFEGQGTFETKSKIRIDEKATPVVHPPRRFPHAIRDRLHDELTEMENSGIIAKVTEPTEWVNSLVVIEKPNKKLRICLDPRDLNKAIKRPHYCAPVLDDVLAKLAGCQYFSKLDARSGYWTIQLDEESSFLTTFNSPFGRYRFLRMPFGINCAQDEFQRLVDDSFANLPGVFPLVDDVLIAGKTRAEHDANLRAALERSRENNIRLNPDKLEVGVTEVNYFGHTISAEGLKPDAEKIKAIQDMPTPTNKKELESFLGMVTYLSKFAPHMSTVTKPLRDLLKKDVPFQWDAQHDMAFTNTKNIITNHPVLTFYDPNKPLTLQVDASQGGCGAAILQDGKPIAYASKALNNTEQNYAQIEKELLAVVFGCKRFHHYVYGHEVTVQSDHKPLESIFKKPLHAAPPRLQRMMLQLQKYRLNLIHLSGKDVPVADALSRNYPTSEDKENIAGNLDFQVHDIITGIPISDEKMKQFKDETQKDKQFCELTDTIKKGWPDSQKDCLPGAQEYFNHRDELTIIDGIVFKGERIVVPPTLRQDVLNTIHSAHFGIEKCKERARDTVFWPGLSSNLDKLISKCQICNEMQNSNSKEPLQCHEIPNRPWQKLGTDLFHVNGRNFLLTVDYYSRFFEVDELKSTTSTAVIQRLSVHFARHGIPEIVISDNATQYTSTVFKEFSQKWDFKHITISPRHSQSNGLAEKYVQIVKNLMEKAKRGKRNLLQCILEYRATPVDNLASPAQLLYGRQVRSIVPTSSTKLNPRIIPQTEVLQRRNNRQQQQKFYYDKHAVTLPVLKEGEKVFMQKGIRDWVPATIIKVGQNRSYLLKTDNTDGGSYWRNRRFIKKQ